MAKKFLRNINPATPGGKEFKAPKHSSGESKKYNQTLDIIIELPDTTDVTVELLSLDGLPETTSSGGLITWINNFSVKKGGSYWSGRDYSVFLPDDHFNAGRKFYYYDGTNLKNDITPTVDSARPGMVKVIFNIGDPATGWSD